LTLPLLLLELKARGSADPSLVLPRLCRSSEQALIWFKSTAHGQDVVLEFTLTPQHGGTIRPDFCHPLFDDQIEFGREPRLSEARRLHAAGRI